MSNIKKLDWYWRSGGAAQAFDSPAPLRVASLDTTTATGWLTKVGADSYNWYLYDAAGSTLLDSDLATSDTVKTFSGLTVNTTYTLKCSANKSGYTESELVSQTVKTFPRMPLFMYQLMGLPELITGTTDQSNEFGVIANSIRVETIKSVVNVDSNLDLNTTTATSTAKAIAQCGNLLPYQHVLPNSGSFFKPTVPINIVGDFTLGFAVYIGATSQIYICATTTTGAFILRKSNNTTTIDAWRGVTYHASNLKTATLPSAIEIGKINYMLIKYVGSNFYAGIFNPDDGTTTWGAAVSGANTSDVELGNFFCDAAGTNVATTGWFSMFGFTGAATDEEIQRSFQYFKMPDYTLQARYSNPTLTLKGVTGWTDLPINGEIADANLDNVGLASIARGFRLPSIADKAVILTHQTLANNYKDQVRFFDFTTGKYSDNIEIPSLGAVNDDHNSGSISEIDGTLLHSELYMHYSDGVPQNIYLRGFGSNFNLTELTEWVQGAGKIQISGTGNQGIQYQGIYQVGNLIVMIGQEWSGSSAKWLTMLVSKDRGNFWEKYRLVEQAGVDWFYPFHVWIEDSTIRTVVDYVDFGTPSYHNKQAYITINPSTKVVSNITGGFSKNVSANAPVTLAELDANYEMNDGVFSFTGNDRRTLCRGHWDGTTLTTIGGNGDGTAFILYEGTSTGWTITELDFGANPVDYANTQTDANNGIGIVGTKIYVRETIATKKQVVEYEQSGGSWANTLTRNGVLTQSAGSDFARMMVTPNSDYNANHLIAAIKQDGGGAGVGTLYLKDIS